MSDDEEQGELQSASDQRYTTQEQLYIIIACACGDEERGRCKILKMYVTIHHMAGKFGEH